MMINGHNHSDLSENLQRCHDYVKALEEERCKIQVFQRELPLCLQLVTQAIETCKQQLSGTKSGQHNLQGQSECSEQTSSELPFFEEFIPLKRASSDSDSEEHESKNACNKYGKDCNDKICKKSDWLRSVQLWNQNPDPPSKEYSHVEVTVSEVNRDCSGGAFNLLKKEKNSAGDVTAAAPPMIGPAPPLSPSSTAGTVGGNQKEDKEGLSQRKARRCWSSELHRKFLQALQQLGGSHVATPKQIRELMKVDGLTNDEVKSHLQKYRLHTRGPSSSTHKNNTQTPQFMVVGGIWVPQEYAAITTTPTLVEEPTYPATRKIYSPIAAAPRRFLEPASSKQRRHIKPSSQSEDNGSYNKGDVQTCSPANSFSTHTATVPPAC